MSTAGKVLVVLVTLVLLGWVVLFSMVSELNRNWGESLDKQTKQVESLSGDVKATNERLDALKTEIAKEQVELRQELVIVHTHMAEAQDLLTDTKEALSRVQIQSAGTKAAITDSEAARVRNEKAVVTLNQEKAAALAQVAQLQSQNDNLLAELDKLRKEFQSTLAQNQKMLQRLLQAPQAREASMVY